MKLRFIVLASALGAAGAANAVVNLAVWNFNDVSTTAARNATTTAGLFSFDHKDVAVSSATMSSDFTQTSSAGIAAFTGSTVGAVSGDTAGAELALEGGGSGSGATYASANNGKHLFITLTGANTALTLDKLTYATRRSGTGFNSQAWDYSVDGGTTYSALTTNTTYNGTNATTAVTTINLNSVKATTITLRLTVTGVTSTGGNNRFDNFVIQGVPEPSSVAALGLGAVALLRRRRSAK